jgi:hypothetical protein
MREHECTESRAPQRPDTLPPVREHRKELTMFRSSLRLNRSAVAGVTVAVFGYMLCALAQPTVAQAADTGAAPAAQVSLATSFIRMPAEKGKCGSPSNPCPTCTIEISTVAFTPLTVYDGSGGNILFSGPEATEAKCDHEAIVQWNNALSTGWSPTNRCLIIAGTGPYDEIFTEITYIYNGGPSVRSDGYAVMCQHSVNVPGVPAY